MKRKIDLYALKLRSTSQSRDTPKRKLSLVKHISSQCPAPTKPSFIVASGQFDGPPLR